MKKILFPVLLFCFAVLSAGEIAPLDAKTVAEGGFVRTIKPSGVYCSIGFKISEKVKPDLALVFEYRVASPVKYYVAVNFRDPAKRMTYSALPESAEWREAVLPLAQVRYADKGHEKLPVGTALQGMSIYAKNTGAKDAAGEIRLELRKVRFETRAPAKKPAAASAPAVKPPPFELPYTVGEKNWAKDPARADSSFRDGVFSVTMKKFDAYTTLGIALNMTWQPDIVCEFEYRVKKNGAKIDYVAANFFRKGKPNTFHQFPVSEDWSAATIRFAKLAKDIVKGEPIPHLSLYIKASAGTPTLEVRNLRFSRDPNYDPLAGVRVSYSAYPLFDWPEEKGATGYRVSVNGKKYEVKDAFFVPDAPLAPDMVEYAVNALPSGREIAKDRLIVPRRNLKWQLPEFDFKAFAAKPHPRYRDLALHFWAPSLEKSIELAKVCVREPTPPDPAPYKEGADPRIRSWIEWYGKVADGVTSKTGHRMFCLGRAVLATGDPELKKAAREKLLDVLKWAPEGGSNMKRGDLQAAWLLRGICWCYDAAYDLLSPEERSAARKIIRVRGDQFWRASFPFRGNEAQNHSWDKMEAAAFAALTLAEEPDMEMRYRYAAAVYAYRFFPSLGFEGENNEGLSYWSYGLGLAVRFVDVARYTLGLDFYTQPWLRQTARFPMYCQPPCGFPVSFADNGKPNHSGLGPLSALFTSKLAASGCDPAALWYSGTPERDGVTAKIPLDIPQSRFYPHIGWAVFNTFLPDGRENVAVGFHSGKYFAGHQHADQNSFVINAYGDKLAIDGGYYDWWGSPHFRKYSVQTQAHNTVLADGRGQDWMVSGSDGVTTHYFDSANFGFVTGDAKKVYQKRVSRFERDLLFVKPDYVFVFDRLEAPKPTVFSWLLHAHTEKPIAFDGAEFAIARPLAGLVGSVLLPRGVKTKVEPAYTVMPVNGYSVDPVPNRQKEWCFTAENAAPIAATEFLAAMKVSRGPDAAPEKLWAFEENADAVLVRNSDAEVLFNRHPGKKVTLGNFTTDARCAAVILAAGKVVDWVKLGGREFAYGDVRCVEFGDLSGANRAVADAAGELVFCGRKAPMTRHVVRYLLGHEIHVLEGILDVPEDGEYTLTCKKPVRVLAAQRGNGTKAETAAPDAPARFKLVKGKLILCVTCDTPVGEVELGR